MILEALLACLFFGVTTHGSPASVRRLNDYGNLGYEYGVQHPAGNSRVLVRTGNGYIKGNREYVNPYPDSGGSVYQHESYGNHPRSYENSKPFHGQNVPLYEESFRYPEPAYFQKAPPNYPHVIHDRSGYVLQPENHKISQSAVDFPIYDRNMDKRLHPVENSGHYGSPLIQEQVAIDEISPNHSPAKFVVQSPLETTKALHGQPPVVQQVIAEDPTFELNNQKYPNTHILSQVPINSEIGHNLNFKDVPVHQSPIIVTPLAEDKIHPQKYEQDLIISQQPIANKPLNIKTAGVKSVPINNLNLNAPVVQQAVVEDLLVPIKDVKLNAPVIQQAVIEDLSVPVNNPKLNIPLVQQTVIEDLSVPIKSVKLNSPVVQQAVTEDLSVPINNPKLIAPIVQQAVIEDFSAPVKNLKSNAPIVQQVVTEDLPVPINAPIVQQVVVEDSPSIALNQKPEEVISQITLDTKPPLKEVIIKSPITKSIIKESVPTVQQKNINPIFTDHIKVVGNSAGPVAQTVFDDHPSQAIYDSSIEPSFSDYDDRPAGPPFLSKPEYQFIPIGPPYEKISHSTEIIHPPPHHLLGSHLILPAKKYSKINFSPQTSKNLPNLKSIKSVPKILDSKVTQLHEDVLLNYPPHSIKLPNSAPLPIKHHSPISPSVKYFDSVPFSVKNPNPNSYSVKQVNPVPYSNKFLDPVIPSIKHPNPGSYFIKQPIVDSYFVKQANPVPYPVKKPNPVSYSVKQPNPVSYSVKHPHPVLHSIKHPNPATVSIKYPNPVSSVKSSYSIPPAVELPEPILHTVKHPNPISPSIKYPNPVPHSVKYPNPVSVSVKHPNPVPSSVKHPLSLGSPYRKELVPEHQITQADLSENSHSSYSIESSPNSPLSVPQVDAPPGITHQHHPQDIELPESLPIGEPLEHLKLSHGVSDFKKPPEEEPPLLKYPPVSHSIRLPVTGSLSNSKPLSADIHPAETPGINSPLTGNKPVSHAFILPNPVAKLEVTTLPNLFAAVPQPTLATFVELDESHPDKSAAVSHALRLPLPASDHSSRQKELVSEVANPANEIPPASRLHSPLSHSLRPAVHINSLGKDRASNLQKQDFPAFPVRSALAQDDPVADKVSELSRPYSSRTRHVNPNREPYESESSNSPSIDEAKREINRVNTQIGASFGDRLSTRSRFS